MPVVPAIMAVGASIGSAAAAGVSAIGGMSGIMSGIAVAGGALQAVGAITGSKALQSIGGIASMAGGIGGGISGLARGVGAMSGASKVGSIAKQAAQATGSAPTNASKLGAFGPMANDSRAQVGLLNSGGQFGGGKVPGASMPGSTAFGGSVSPMGGVSQQTGDALPFDSRLQDLMARYDNTSMWGMQALAGASDAYMMYEMTKMRQEPEMARLRFDQQQANISRANMGSVPSLAPAVNQGGFLDQGFVN